MGLVAGAAPLPAIAADGSGAKWAVSQVHRHVHLSCATFLATTQDDSFVVGTFNNTNTTGTAALWHFPRGPRAVGEPRILWQIEVGAYRGVSGVAAANDGSIYATVDQSPDFGSAMVRLLPDFRQDPNFGDGGMVRLDQERATGLAIGGGHAFVGLAWNRIRTFEIPGGTLVGESPSSGSSSNPDGSTGAPRPAAIPPWIGHDEATTRGASPRIRDLAFDPATGRVFGTSADRVFVFEPLAGRPGKFLAPQLFIDGSGPVLPAQGVHFLPATRQLWYAINQRGTMAIAEVDQIPDGAAALTLFPYFQATGPSFRAVDCDFSSDGRTLFLSDLSGTITEYRRRSGSGTETGLDTTIPPQGGSGQSRGGADPPGEQSLSASLDKRTILRGDKLLATPRPDRHGKAAGLLLFTIEPSATHHAAVEALLECLPELPSHIRAGRCDARNDRRLVMRYGIYVTPTLLLLDGMGRELFRHEGPVTAESVRFLVRSPLGD